MNNHSKDTKRIAQNTILLYCRMLILLLVSLYTSRLVLNGLGVTDYGICNVVGGFIALFSMVSDSLSKTISRFLTFNLGKGEKEKLHDTFCSSVIVQIGMSIIFLLVAETLGLWFFNTKLNIPSNRLFAAQCVYQLSIVSFILNLISVPYNASIISHEKMGAFAYISIYEAAAKLAIAFALFIPNIDKLILYSTLSCVVALSVRFIYGLYCEKHFDECKFKFKFNKNILVELSKFASWNFLGSAAIVLRVQGTNVLLNMFFGPAINAAKGIANQVTNILHSFVANFMMALSPQITKSYANGDLDYEKKLMFTGSKFSFFILLFISLPVFLETHFILKIWLNIVPAHTILFVRLILFYTLMNTLTNTMGTAIMATGKIKYFEIVISSFEFLNIPLSYILLKKMAMPEIVTIVCIIISLFTTIATLLFLKKYILFSIKQYFKEVYFRSWLVFVCGAIIPFFIACTNEESWTRFLIVIPTTLLTTILSILFIGCNKSERTYIHSYSKQIINKIYHK